MKNAKCQIPNSQCPIRQGGFTLIELILYVALVTMLLLTVVPFAWNVIEGGVKLGVEQEVYSQARYVSERIKKEIREGSAINSCTSTVLSIANPTASLNPTVFTYTGGSTDQLTIRQGTGAIIRIHSTDTLMTAFSCTNYTGAGTDNVRVNFTLNANYAGSTRNEYDEAVVMQVTAETRN